MTALIGRSRVLPYALMLAVASPGIGPAQAAESVGTTVSGGLRLQYLWQSTDHGGTVETVDRARIDKAWLDISTAWRERWRAQLTVEAKNLGTREQTDPTLRELTMQYVPDWGRLYAGQFVLPFGRFATSQVSDPQTKELGEWFTNAGTGGTLFLSKSTRMAFAAFAQNDQTIDRDQDGAVVAIEWSSPLRWHLGAAYLGTTHSDGRDVRSAWTANGGVDHGAWRLRAEFLARHVIEAERQTAWFADIAYHFAEAWTLGVRRQGADGYAIIESADREYRDWGLTLRYRFSRNLSLGIELLQGEQHVSDGEAVSRDEIRSRLEFRV